MKSKSTVNEKQKKMHDHVPTVHSNLAVLVINYTFNRSLNRTLIYIAQTTTKECFYEEINTTFTAQFPFACGKLLKI